MFPELASVLNEAYEAAFDRLEDSSAVVSGSAVTRYRDASQNLRTTRETELMEEYPYHTVVAWFGHSEKVARKHYLQVTDTHFEKAVAPKACATDETKSPLNAKDRKNSHSFRGPSDDFASLRENKLPRRDSNPN